MKKFYIFTLVIMFIIVGCTNSKIQKSEYIKENTLVKEANKKTIYLAGGCFWGVEGYLKELNGVISTNVGYANGKTEDTNYHALSRTEHAETVMVVYDKSRISLEELLLRYFKVIDPKSLNRQGNDIGRQYRTGVYYIDKEDLKVIEKVFEYETSIHGDIVVEKEPLKNFVLAEDYHQDYLEKNPNGYCHINIQSANDPLFDENYPLPDKDLLDKILDKESYDVLINSATEMPFSSELDKEYRKGIYVDKLTGEPLFSSTDKFDSGCGWPSFSKPITSDRIEYSNDNSHGMKRIEVRSKGGHLGHVFDDGIEEKGGLRYCINGAALRFIPYEDMDKEGYSKYKIFCE